MSPYIKILRTIKSCTTPEHLAVARKMVVSNGHPRLHIALTLAEERMHYPEQEYDIHMPTFLPPQRSWKSYEKT